jgi:two-component system sensor histidine kinase ChvG
MARYVKFQRLRSLSARVLVAGTLLFLSPLAFIAVSEAIEGSLARGTEFRIERCARAIGHAWSRERSLEDASESSCREAHLRVRIMEGGHVREIADHFVSSSFDDLVGDLFYGPERSEILASLESTLLPIVERPETISALEHGQAMVCEQRPDGNLRICSSALSVTRARTRAIVHVMGSSRSARISRYAQRRELAGMVVFGAALAVLLVTWLHRRVTETVRDLARDIESLESIRDGRLHEERPRELAEVAARFNRLRESLARADARNEAFLADLAHEMKNPVAAISAAAESLDGPHAADPERRARLARSIAASASKLELLIMKFLELARAESGLPRDERERVNLGALIEGVISTTNVSNGKQLIVERHESLPDIDGVPVRLESAVRNLVDNALSFAKSEVRVRLRHESNTVLFEVEDDGPGISPEDLPRVFDRFFSRRVDGGTGLGLSIVRAIVQAHGGTIEAHSEVERRTTFVVRFSTTRRA